MVSWKWHNYFGGSFPPLPLLFFRWDHLSCRVTQSWKEVQSWLFSPVYVTTSLPLASIGWTKLVGFWGWGGFLWISPLFIMCAFHLTTSFSIRCLLLLSGGRGVPEFLVCLVHSCLPAAVSSAWYPGTIYRSPPSSAARFSDSPVPCTEPTPSPQLSSATRSTPLLTSGLCSHCSPTEPASLQFSF